MSAMYRSLTVGLLLLFFLASCGGGGQSSLGGPGAGSLPGSNGVRSAVSLKITIPGGSAPASTLRRTPQTVSSLTQSITVSVNGGGPQIFNAAAPTCTGTNPMTCSLTVGAPFGADGFLVITYSGTNGTGTPLNAAAFTINVTQGGSNAAAAVAGNIIVVNSAQDGSGSGFSCAGGT